MNGGSVEPMRPVILGTLVVCLAVAVAPWLTGGQQPLAMLITGGALLLAALLAWRQPAVRFVRRGPLLWAWVAFMIWAGLSEWWTVNHYSTGLWLTQWLLAGLAFGLAYTIAGERKGRDWLLQAYLASAVAFCVVAIAMYLTSSYERLTGPFYWPNLAAAYLMPALFLAVDGLRRVQGRTVWLWWGQVVLFGVAFLLTDSRAALFVLLITGFVYFLIIKTNRIFWITLVFALMAAFGFSLIIGQVGTITVHERTATVPGARLTEVASGQSRSLSDRLYYLRSGLEMWFDRPLLGVGAGGYGDIHPAYQERVVSASTNAHNVYVQTLAELGLVGAALLAAVLLWLGVGLLRGVVHQPTNLAVVAGVVALLMHFGLDIDARYPALLLLVAVLMGAVYRQWSEARSGLPWLRPAVAAGLLVPLISIFLSQAAASRATVAQSDGDYQLAADYYATAARGIVANPDFLSAEGIARYAEAASGGEATEAALALDRARTAQRLDPYDGQHYQLEGRVLIWRGDASGATAAFRQALEHDPYNHPDYALDLASAQLRAGDVEAAVHTARAMLDQYPDAVVVNRSADTKLRPALADLAALIGNVRLQQGRVAEAATATKQGLKIDGQNLRIRALKRAIERLQGRL